VVTGAPPPPPPPPLCVVLGQVHPTHCFKGPHTLAAQAACSRVRRVGRWTTQQAAAVAANTTAAAPPYLWPLLQR